MGRKDARAARLTPLYRQVATALADAIDSGAIAGALPGEHALCDRFAVSRITIRKALDELVQRRLVVRRHGVGTFVSEPGTSTWSVNLTGIIEDVITPNALVILGERTVRLPAKLATLAKLPPSTPVRSIESVNHLGDGEPLVYVRYFFPLDIADGLTGADFAGPVQAIKVVEAHAGRRALRAEQVVEALIADGRIARHLKITPGTAVLRARRAYFDDAGKPMEIFDAAYHPLNYRYAATLYPRQQR